MRQFETRIQELKSVVLTEVARLAFEDRLATGVLDIPERVITGDKATVRCCVYKERAIIGSRVKMALGGDKGDPGIVEVLSIACDECPVTEMDVTEACRGCLATRCIHACPKDAITMVNHRAQIDHSKCIICGKCLNACPYGAIVKHRRPCEKGCPVNAISMGEDRKAQIDPNKCIACGSCVNQCPFGAIMDKSFLVDAVQLLLGSQRWGYHLYAVVAPSIAGQFAPAAYGQVVAGLKKLGFNGVTEVALGADVVAAHEAEELAEKGRLASSCCPAFVSYVIRNHPDLQELVSKAPSPMLTVGRYIKEHDHRAKVIFIGPCVAKKREFQLGRAMKAVDCVLTFEELYALFEAREIDLTQLAAEELNDASAYGRGFACSGGVTAAIAEALKEQGLEDFSLRAEVCSGVEECKRALLRAKAGALEANFIEGMACAGGCVNGAGCIVRAPENKPAVKAHGSTSRVSTIGEAVELADREGVFDARFRGEPVPEQELETV